MTPSLPRGARTLSLAWLLALPMLAHADASADTGQAWLPTEPQVRQVLEQSPQVREAGAGIAAADAHARRLQLGPHEWQARVALDRRDARPEDRRFTEQEIGLERTLRWPGKADADARLGDTGARVARLAHADAWHEAARALLADWADAVREARAAQVLAAQSALVEQQLGAVDQRIRAGEAARMERLAVQAEQARASAAATQAQNRAALLARTLAVRYPGLQGVALAAALPAPPETATPADHAVQRILDDNHELELAEAQAALARRQAERTALDRRADPTVGVRAARERGGQERVLGVFVTVPLGQAGRQADAARALAEADQAEQRLQQTRRRVQAQAQRVAQAAPDALLNWRQLDAARQHTQASADLQVRAWRLGESPLAEVLQARRLAQEATLAAETARVDALAAQARLLLDQHQLWAPEHDAPAPPR